MFSSRIMIVRKWTGIIALLECSSRIITSWCATQGDEDISAILMQMCGSGLSGQPTVVRAQDSKKMPTGEHGRRLGRHLTMLPSRGLRPAQFVPLASRQSAILRCTASRQVRDPVRLRTPLYLPSASPHVTYRATHSRGIGYTYVNRSTEFIASLNEY